MADEKLNQFLKNAEKLVKTHDLLARLQYKGHRGEEARKEAAPVAFEEGVMNEPDRYGPGKAIEKPEDQTDTLISGNLEAYYIRMSDNVQNELEENIDDIAQSIPDETLEKISQDKFIVNEAGEEYVTTLNDYLHHKQQLDKAKELAKRNIEELPVQEKRAIYSNLAPEIEKDLEEKLRKRGESQKYIKTVVNLSRIASDEGFIPASYVSKAAKAFVEKAEKEFNEYREKTKDKKNIPQYVREAITKLVKEGGPERDEHIIELLYSVFKK